ncbi:MAG: hypothetical protein CH104c_0794 [Candidatus Woesebacteria bacterium]|nr:MAG: hypothetical protein CH104c_0794 [Candidatus Woesebacteria bacterium]
MSILAEAKEKTGTGLKKETSAALSYVLGFITGIIFLIIEKDPFVRFHAMQSIVVSLAFFVLSWILGIISVLLGLTVFLAWVGPLLSGVLMIGGFVLWLLLIYKAYQGEKWQVPYIGKFVERMV